MEKGRFGIRICFYTVLAFVLAALGYSTPLFLLAGVVLIAEKSEWGTRQIVQAIFLCFVETIISNIMEIFNFLYKIPFISTMWGSVDGIISSLVWIVVLAFCIVGIIKNVKGEDASIPFVSKFADWAFGAVNVNGKTEAASAQTAPAAENTTQKTE